MFSKETIRDLRPEAVLGDWQLFAEAYKLRAEVRGVSEALPSVTTRLVVPEGGKPDRTYIMMMMMVIGLGHVNFEVQVGYPVQNLTRHL